MRERYGASPRSQMLKYHIQTSGRSLHAQESVQRHPHHPAGALCAVRQPQLPSHQRLRRSHHHATEDSVRRAVAIQRIINRELGLTLRTDEDRDSLKSEISYKE